MKDPAITVGLWLEGFALALGTVPFALSLRMLQDGPDWAHLVLLSLDAFSVLSLGIGSLLGALVFVAAVRRRDRRALSGVLALLNLGMLVVRLAT